MKKVININFQGRVIPIEETAYELLKQYIESLRRYFANEEGRDEIINDIEGRIAELFSERIKKGATCITDEDVNTVIASMGRPEDFEAETVGSGTETNGNTSQQQQSSQSQSQSTYNYGAQNRAQRGRLYRNADDKILGGVASGLANYFGIDPVVMRILFVVLFAPLFWVYILLWVIIPSQSIETNITKRLYRSAEDKVISGVCGGLSAYFNTPTWVPRLIFALPLIFGLISGVFNNIWWHDWDFWWGPKVITGSLGSTLFFAYVILWITVPVAVSSSEKLEMRGEKVDLNSIRDTVKEDLEGFKAKAEKWGKEVKESAQQFGEKAKEFGQTAGSRAKTFSAEAGPVARGAGSGIGHVIGVLFKAFFMVLAAIIVVALFAAIAGVIFGGFTMFPVKDFIFEGFGENLLAWATLILFLGIPLIALITWLIRRIMGVRSRNHYLGYVFSTLWIVGLICAFILSGTVYRNFRSSSFSEEEVKLTQPANNKLIIDVANTYEHYYGGDWFGISWEDAPFYAINQDTLMLNTVRVNIQKSNDANFHVRRVRLCRGNNPQKAKDLAERVSFNIEQKDSILELPKGFAISRFEKFRNQQVLVIIEVPVGKRIRIDGKVDDYEWFSINYNRRRGFRNDYNWDNSYSWTSDRDMIMTPEDGLQPVDKYDQIELKSGKFKLKIKDGENEIQLEGELNNNESDKKDTTPGYRYPREKEKKQSADSTRVKEVEVKTAFNSSAENETARNGHRTLANLAGPVASLAKLL
ncbi:PspC domain-containing protein [Paraflavitalea sp. CAU 1676]|uniref:PspC domain-containing protein n=1 Tax=Paraflavitalea sp. CAU 1676 TaxID=3032598 RepID=UPI0023DBDD82|nr:PspC domain-containing protein [Paraflavitalea sp. CAU 1676]MDF2190952.1 PspC domain-containing protein [Paraflavitalea sp. CAU 1676]